MEAGREDTEEIRHAMYLTYFSKATRAFPPFSLKILSTQLAEQAASMFCSAECTSSVIELNDRDCGEKSVRAASRSVLTKRMI